MKTFLIFAVFAAVAVVTPVYSGSITFVTSADKQCKNRNHAGVCHAETAAEMAKICQNLVCASSENTVSSHRYHKYAPIVTNSPALPGTICGASKVCNDQSQCVPVQNVPLQKDSSKQIYKCLFVPEHRLNGNNQNGHRPNNHSQNRHRQNTNFRLNNHRTINGYNH